MLIKYIKGIYSIYKTQDHLPDGKSSKNEINKQNRNYS